MTDDYKKGYNLTPHEEEEDFDWKKAKLYEDGDIYVIYPDPSYTPEIKKRIIEELKFVWNTTQWERTEPFTKQEIDDLLLDGITIEKH
jgi:hypothetical protein